MIFAVTERGSFKRCHRQALLTSKNGQHLEPLSAPLHFAVGSIVHRAQQLWLLHPETPLPEHALTASLEVQARVTENYRRAVGCAPSQTEMQETLASVDMAVSMCENYQLKWGKPLPDEYTLIKPEQKVLIPVEATRRECSGCDGRGWVVNNPLGLVAPVEQDRGPYRGPCPWCDGTGEEVHYLSGTLDGFILHQSGRIDVLERKTYKSRPKEESLKTNDQFLAYVWLVTQLGITDQVPCLAYDGMWRRDKVPRGRTFDDLFLRVLVTRNRHELEEFERFLPIDLNNMADVYRHTEKATTHRRWQGCWDCSVEKLCTAMSRGEDTASLIAHSYTTRTDDLDEDEAEDE